MPILEPSHHQGIMLKCTPYIKDMCKNINTTLFNAEMATEDGKVEEDEEPTVLMKPKQTTVQLTDIKSSSTKELLLKMHV